MSQPFTTIRRSSYNAWVPQSNLIHDSFIQHLLKSAKALVGHKVAVVAFDNAVTADQKDFFTKALVQVAQYYAKWADPSSVVTSWDDFLTLLDAIVESPPQFYKAQVGDVTIGEPIGVPLYLILDLVSNTSAAYTLFTEPSFNRALKDLLNSWGSYLKDPDRDSNSTLNSDGWFSDAGLAVLESGLGRLTFDETYLSDGDPKYYTTWDSFFTRQLRDGVRPVQTDATRVFINNACESTVLRTATNIQLHDTFWLKSQNYSVYDMLGGTLDGSLAAYANNFDGGSVYQAFLSPQDYHRWRSPVKGNIVASVVLPGTYYAILPDDGAPPYDTDLVPGDPHGGLIRSQPWLSVAATRAVYIIQPDSSLNLDWVALIGIGMAEVSTCEIPQNKLVGPGADPVPVEAGDEIGMFHFGGSSHTLILQPTTGYKVVFQDYYETPIRPGQHRWISSAIAQVRAV